MATKKKTDKEPEVISVKAEVKIPESVEQTRSAFPHPPEWEPE